MSVASFLSKFKLRYQDYDEEKEYRNLRFELSKKLFGWLFFFVGILFIPLTLRYFTKHLSPQNYIGVGFIVVAALIFLFRRQLQKYLEIISILYISFMLGIYIANMRIILDKQKPHEAFYLGYSFALVGRMLDYRIIDFKKIAVFTIVFIFLKFFLVSVPNTPQVFLAVCLELFPLIMAFIVEKADRVLFDTLHKSKNQLLKFKQVLTEQLPNQMAIFAQDFGTSLFINNCFHKSFRSDRIEEIKKIFENFTIDEEDFENNKEILSLLSLDEKQAKITLSNLLERVSKHWQTIRAAEVLTFQVSGSTMKEAKKVEEKIVITTTEPLETVQMNQRCAFRISSEDCERSFIIREKKEPSLVRLCSSPRENLRKSSEGEEDFERKTFKVKIFPIMWNEQDAIALIFDDITHEKTIMELTKIADKNKDLVIAMISHELRTPINGMLGLMEIVKKKLANLQSTEKSDIFSYIEACKSSSYLLLNLVNSILDFSQIKNNKLHLTPTQFSISEALSELKSLFGHFCVVKNLYLEIEIDPDVPEIIKTDRTRLSQILINLVGNAFKFTFHGGVKIKVKKMVSRGRLEFRVEDTGIGIKREDQEKLFKMFGRLEQMDKRVNTNGVGLGLTISNTLAVLLNPENDKGIEVESEAGRGSTFSFVIGISSEVQEIDTSLETSNTDIRQMGEYDGLHSGGSRINEYNESRASRRKNRLSNFAQPFSNIIPTTGLPLLNCLVVDDNPFNLMVATNLLEEKSYTVKTAMNGKEAVESTKEHEKHGLNFDLILMDCQMPIMDGYEASRTLRKMMTEGEIKECPIIALTANNRDEVHERMLKDSGMSGHIAKPLQMQEFQNVLNQVKNPK